MNDGKGDDVAVVDPVGDGASEGIGGGLTSIDGVGIAEFGQVGHAVASPKVIFDISHELQNQLCYVPN